MTRNTGKNNGGEIMTLTEIARYLKLSEKTILRMIKAGRVPATKVGSRWRFMRTVIDDWLTSRMQSVSRQNLLGIIGTTDRPIPISQLVSPSRIVLDLQPGARDSVLSQLVAPLQKEGIVPDGDAFVARLLGRERTVSTAIAHGVALPHVRDPRESPVREPCIVLGVCRNGTDFQALDGRKTHVFALICGKTEGVQLRLMAKASLLFRRLHVIQALRKAKTTKEVMSLLGAVDSEIRTRRQGITNSEGVLKSPCPGAMPI